MEEVFLDSISDTKTFTTLQGDQIDIVKAGSGKLFGWKVTHQHSTTYCRMNRAASSLKLMIPHGHLKYWHLHVCCFFPSSFYDCQIMVDTNWNNGFNIRIGIMGSTLL